MEFQLFHITKAPRELPPWELIINDLNKPSAVQIARTLDVGVSTVFRWQKTGNVPRSAVMALFWLTRWGHSLIDTSATNDAIFYANMCRALQLENAGLKSHIELLGRQRDKLSHQVAHFAALAQGLEPAAIDLEDEAHGAGLSQIETFRKVLLAPSGASRHPTPSAPPHRPVSAASPVRAAPVAGHPARPGALCAEGVAARSTETGDEEESGRREPAEAACEAPAGADEDQAGHRRSAGVLRWPGADSAAPLQRPQAASLGASPQPPTGHGPNETSKAVFSALVQTTIAPGKPPRPRQKKRATEGKPAAHHQQDNEARN